MKSFNQLVFCGLICPSVVRSSRVALTLLSWSPARSERARLGQRGAGQQSVVLTATATAQGNARSTRRRSRRVPGHVAAAAARQLQTPAVCKCCAGRNNAPAVSLVFRARLAVITSSSKCAELPCQARASPCLTGVRRACRPAGGCRGISNAARTVAGNAAPKCWGCRLTQYERAAGRENVTACGMTPQEGWEKNSCSLPFGIPVSWRRVSFLHSANAVS